MSSKFSLVPKLLVFPCASPNFLYSLSLFVTHNILFSFSCYETKNSTKMQPSLTPLLTILKLTFLTLSLSLQPLHTLSLSSCRAFCGNIAIKYPFGLDDGCGAPQYRHMLNCSIDLFFITPSGGYKVQSIDYDKKTMTVYDPAMSTCSILQPHHDFIMTDIQSAIIPPSADTVFVLLNCSIDSPVLNHYKNLCFNFSDHSCDELYGSCNAFRLFHLVTNTSSPPCCFTSYDTVKFMSMNILDCTHYTSVINTDNLKGIGPLDWVYGIKMSYSVPDTGCERCKLSGGTCGFDTETEVMQCLCTSFMNSTRECAAGIVADGGVQNPWSSFQAFLLVVGALIYLNL